MADDRMMPDKSLYLYLERRAREARNQIAALKAETATKSKELTHVLSAKQQIANLGGDDQKRLVVPAATSPAANGNSQRPANFVDVFAITQVTRRPSHDKSWRKRLTSNSKV